jgi:hypothetical protein
MQLRGKLVTSQLLREEEKEEDTDYVAIPLRHDSFASSRIAFLSIFLIFQKTFFKSRQERGEAGTCRQPKEKTLNSN